MRNLETTTHLFKECGYSLVIWEKAGGWLTEEGLQPTNWEQTQDLCQWFVNIGNCGQRSKREGLRPMVMLIAGEIWKERNNRIFNDAARSTDQLFHAIQDEARTWIRAGNAGLELVLPLTGMMSQSVDDTHPM